MSGELTFDHNLECRFRRLSAEATEEESDEYQRYTAASLVFDPHVLDACQSLKSRMELVVRQPSISCFGPALSSLFMTDLKAEDTD